MSADVKLRLVQQRAGSSLNVCRCKMVHKTVQKWCPVQQAAVKNTAADFSMVNCWGGEATMLPANLRPLQANQQARINSLYSQAQVQTNGTVYRLCHSAAENVVRQFPIYFPSLTHAVGLGPLGFCLHTVT